MEETMKKSLILLIAFAVFAFVACGSKKDTAPENTDGDSVEKEDADDYTDESQITPDEESDEDQNVSNDETPANPENLVCTQESKETLGGEGCRCRISEDPTRRFGVSCGSGSFKVDNVSCDDGNICVISGKVILENGELGEGSCSLEFENYGRELFDEFPLGSEILVSFNGEPMGISEVARLKDGTLLAALKSGAWLNGDAPEITAEQKIIHTCENVCIETNREWMKEPYYDYVYYPPVEFKIGENEPVLVSNGQVVVSEGYEYYVYGSETISPDDPDHKLYHEEESEMPDPNYGIFDFIILNRNALK